MMEMSRRNTNIIIYHISKILRMISFHKIMFNSYYYIENFMFDNDHPSHLGFSIIIPTTPFTHTQLYQKTKIIKTICSTV